MNFADSFETPIAIEFEGKQYLLNKLHGRDYLVWIAEIEKSYRDRNLPMIEELSGNERIQHKSAVLGREFTPDDCQSHVGTLKGSERVITASFVKTITGKRIDNYRDDDAVGVAVSIADRFIETLDWQDQLALALRLSGLFLQEFFDRLFGVKKPDARNGETRLPNVSAAQNAASEIPATGK